MNDISTASIIFLIVSILFFITTFGLFDAINKKPSYDQPPLFRKLFLIPFLCRIVLPVIACSVLFQLHWMISLLLVFVLTPFISQALLLLIPNSFLGYKIIFCFIAGLVSLGIGLLIK